LDLFITPRRSRPVTRYASPLKVVEALELETPVIATSEGDLPRLLADGRGRLVAGDPKALAVAISELKRHPEKRREMVNAIRRWKPTAGTWQDAAETQLEVYRRVLGRD